METPSGIKWIYSRKNGKWEIIKDKNAEVVSLAPSSPPSSKAGSGGEGLWGRRGGGGRKGNNNGIGNSDEPPHPPFPNGHDPHDSSSSSDSSNNPRRKLSLGRLLLLPPGGSIIYSGSVRGRSANQKYETTMIQMKLPKCLKETHQMTPSHMENCSTQ